MGTAAPAMMPTEDLKVVIDELPAMKDVLREAFHCLAACSPSQLPFTWEDLDAHVSSVQSSISRRFRQLRTLEAARPVRARKNKEGANDVGEEEEVEEVEAEVVEEEEEEEKEVEAEADKQMEEADGYIANEAYDAKEGGEDDKQDADEEAVTTMVSAGQGEEAKGEEELDGYAQWDGEKQDTEEEEMVEKMTTKQLKLKGFQAGQRNLPRHVREWMQVEFVIWVTFDTKLLFALHQAPDPAALVLQVVKLLLSSKDFKCSRVWGKCVTLFRWLSMNRAKHSADTTQQAKLVAKDCKEMIGRPEYCGELESLARGFLQFLISYNIVSEFNIHDIISIFAMVPRKGQKNKNNTDIFRLCKNLGLADRVTDLIDYMIGNEQHLEVFHLLQFFSLEDKYPPFSLLKGYIEKAKQIYVEIFRKNETHKSLNLAVPRELRIAYQLAEQKLADSRQRSAILAEIGSLIGAYKEKRRSGNPSTWESQHQPTNCNKRDKKRKKEELEHNEAQLSQQQQAQNQNKLNQGMQHQLHQQENKAQVTEQQQQYMQPPRPATLKLPTPDVPLVPNDAQIQNFGRPPYAAMPGVHNYPAQPGWPVGQGMPFVPQFRSPQYMGLPFDPFALHPPAYPR